MLATGTKTELAKTSGLLRSVEVRFYGVETAAASWSLDRQA
jgi:hypothetical protein